MFRTGGQFPCGRRFSRPSRGITFVEILMAFLIMGAMLLPVFYYLTNAVKETERFYAEAVALSQAKFVMDTLMFQIPWRAIRAGNPCRFEDPKNVTAITSLLGAVIPRMFGSGYEGPSAGIYVGDGLLTDRKGFLYRIRVQCIDLPDVEFAIDIPGKGVKAFQSKELTPKDADGTYSLMKKLTVEIRWSLLKGRDPLLDKHAKSLHLTAVKSFLDG